MTGKATPTNVNFINVCAGFERGRDVVDYFIPSTGKDAKDSRVEWEEQSSDTPQSLPIEGDSQDHLKNLIDPRLRNRKGLAKGKKEKGKTKKNSKIQEQLEIPSQTGSIFGKVFELFQYIFCICIWPLAWCFCKTPRRASETVTWATIVPIHFDKTFETNLKGLAVVPGELHREGRIVRPELPPTLTPGPSTESLWKMMEDKAKEVLKL